MQNALLDGLIEGGNRLAENLPSCSFVAFCQGLAEIAQCGAQSRGVASVALCAGFGLPGAFERGKMICHCR
jgi:hypothetical protein